MVVDDMASMHDQPATNQFFLFSPKTNNNHLRYLDSLARSSCTFIFKCEQTEKLTLWLILDGQYDIGDIVDSLGQITAQVRQSLTHIYLSIRAYDNGESKKFLDCFRCSRFEFKPTSSNNRKVLCKMLKLGKGNPQGTSDIESLKPIGSKVCSKIDDNEKT